MRRAACEWLRYSSCHSDGPFEGLTKGELPGQMCTFAREVLRAGPDPRAVRQAADRIRDAVAYLA